MVSQSYVTEGENEYVIRGNSAILKCKIPSFVADFVSVESWVSNEGEIFTVSDPGNNFGKTFNVLTENESLPHFVGLVLKQIFLNSQVHLFRKRVKYTMVPY